MNEAGGYRIGAVSRMTGIALATLRMWERRYRLVDPERTSAGGRLYSREDVARLSLIHAAVQAGHAIGTVAKLSDEELRKRIHLDTESASQPRDTPIRLAVIGPELPGLVAGAEVMDPGIAVVYTGADLDLAEAALEQQVVDVLLVELPQLFPERMAATVDTIRSIGARLTLVVYGFTSQKFLRRLDALNTLCVRAPADIPQLLRLCRLGVGPGAANDAEVVEDCDAQAPRFDDAQLRRLMTMASAVRCECPQQLSVLLTSLYAFEQFSLECARRYPQAAATHQPLTDAAIKARRKLEHALTKLLQVEGISLQ